MSGLLGSSNSQSTPVAVGALSIQQSSYSTPVMLVYGTNRVAGNLLDYQDFQQILVSTGGGGGKGGVLGGGGKGGGSQEYNYSASFAIGICEGEITGVGQVWVSKQISSIPALGGTLFTGATDQEPWGYFSSNYPTHAIGYNTLCYAGFPNFSLGTSAETPQFNFEVNGILVIGGGNQDAYFDQVLIDVLTRAGFPVAMIDAFTTCATYWKAMGFFVSPVLDQQRQLNDWMNEWMLTMNAEFVFTNNVLTAVPRGDSTVTGNGVTYTPNLTPIYNIGDDDFIVDGDEDPVTINIPDTQDAYNQMPIEYCNRADQYNLETYTAEDAAQIDMFSYRTAPTLTAHHVTDPVMAQNMAYLALWKGIYIDCGPQYVFKLPWNYILLDPMDLISINDPAIAGSPLLVRVKSIKENESGELEFTCEAMPGDLTAIATYNQVTPSKYTANYNIAAPNVNVPVFFETPLALAQTAIVQLCIGLSGAGPTWGGCNIWVSTDGETYQFLMQVNGSTRMGVLTEALAAFTQPAGGTTIDTTDSFGVNMTMSEGSFQNSAVNTDAAALNTLCFVDGEFLAFGQDILTAEYKYTLSYLNRGAYDTASGLHAIGSSFVRFDQSVPRYTVDQTRIGQTIYFKFLSFNQWGGGLQTLDSVPAYNYTILGTALITPLENPIGLCVYYANQIAQLSWQPISDVRSPIFYQIRKGSSFGTAQIVGQTSSNSYLVFGTDTYWVTAFYNTPTGVAVYSLSPPSVAVSTAALAQYLVETWDEASTSWSGTCSGSAVVVGDTIEVNGSANILGDSNILTNPNILNYAAAAGIYTAPSGHTITSNYVVDAKVIIDWTLVAESSTSDVTAIADVPSTADITGAAPAGTAIATPQIRLSTDGGMTYGAWQNWTPGVYTFNAIQYQIIIQSLSLTVLAILTDFAITVDVPLRTDNGTSTGSLSADTTVNYPNGEFNELLQVTAVPVGGSAGDTVNIVSQGLTSFVYSVYNALGARVADAISYTATGY